MKKLLSGNEALALGAYHAGVKVATAYPGTPSTEILENLARYPGLHAEWSTNEKVALEVALGASYAGVRALASMKHVGLNVAGDPFMAAATTGVRGGLVIISADDPGMHSSQNEQDSRYYAKLAKIPILEPADSQEAYEFIKLAFEISEKFDTPVMLRSTTRVSHAKSVVIDDEAAPKVGAEALFVQDLAKLVMLPVNARGRHPLALARLARLREYGEDCGVNYEITGDNELGVIGSGVAFNYAREVLRGASFLKLGLSYPLPEHLIRRFAAKVKTLVVAEELEPLMEEQIKAMGLVVHGKDVLPQTGEFSADIVRRAAITAGWIKGPTETRSEFSSPRDLPARPPLLCPGCPHTGLFFTLSSLGLRKPQPHGQSGLIITGDIGCYTLGAYQPLAAMDTCACMGAGIGQAQGLEWAGVPQKVISVIGDSTFMHSGITSLINAVYNRSQGVVVILDNGTTAMTGHQPHPGSGITAQGQTSTPVSLEALIHGAGVEKTFTVDAFDLGAIRSALKEAMDHPGLAVIIVRGPCAVAVRTRAQALMVDEAKCNRCGVCLRLGCPAMQTIDGQIVISATHCTGCGLCGQLCVRGAIGRTEGGSCGY